MNERLKALRKKLDLTQEEFSKKIGIKRNTLANYEIGRNEPIDGIVFSICREFSVNEEWLRTGNGDMFTAVPTEELDKLAERYKLSNMAKRFVKTFVELEESQKNAVLNFMVAVVVEGDEVAATVEQEEQLNKWEVETDRVQAILDAQKVLDSTYNENIKKGKLSS